MHQHILSQGAAPTPEGPSVPEVDHKQVASVQKAKSAGTDSGESSFINAQSTVTWAVFERGSTDDALVHVCSLV